MAMNDDMVGDCGHDDEVCELGLYDGCLSSHDVLALLLCLCVVAVLLLFGAYVSLWLSCFVVLLCSFVYC